MTIQTYRQLGGIGACLTVIGALSSILTLAQYASPNFSIATFVLASIGSMIGFLGFIGLILFLVAMYGFSKDYNESKIFSNIIYGIIAAIIALAIAAILVIFLVFSNLASFSPTPQSPTEMLGGMTAIFSLILPIVGAIGIVYYVFLFRSFNLLAKKSEVSLFRTGALVLLVGAVVAVIFNVAYTALALNLRTLEGLSVLSVPGSIVQGIAWILFAMAFFRIKAPAIEPSNAGVFVGQQKFCSNCGSPNRLDASFCTRCGHKLEG